MADAEAATIDALIARATPKVDFSPIGNLPQTYWEGLAAKSAKDQREVFKDGVPTNSDGSLDYKSMIQMFGKTGAVDKIIPLANAASTADLVKGYGNQENSQPQPTYQPPPNATPAQPQSPRPNVVGYPEGVRDGTYDPPAGPGQRPPIQPDAPPPMPAPPRPSGVVPGQVGQSNPTEAIANEGRMRAVMERAHQASIIAANAGNVEMAKAFLAKFNAIKEQLSPTNEVKNYNIGRQPGETLVSYESRTNREKAISSATGKAMGEQIAEYIDQGRSSQKRIQQLDVMRDALERGDGNMTTGPFANIALKGKQAIGSLFGFDVSGTSEAEVVQKMGFGFATQAVKEISQRPSQLEFVKGMENNPGLLLSPKGSLFMMDILRQGARQDAQLAKLAQRPENHGNWAEVVDRFYNDPKNALVSPFDRTRKLGMKDYEVLKSQPQTAQAGSGDGWTEVSPGVRIRERK